MSSEHPCIFCDVSCTSIDEIVLHLFLKHHRENIAIGTVKRRFAIYLHSGRDRVLCFCGQRFTCASAALDAAPFFQEWALKQSIEIDSYAAHLRREGGLEKHLKDLRQQVMLDKVAGTIHCKEEWAVAGPGPDWSLSFLGQAIAEMSLDKITEPSLE